MRKECATSSNSLDSDGMRQENALTASDPRVVRAVASALSLQAISDANAIEKFFTLSDSFAVAAPDTIGNYDPGVWVEVVTRKWSLGKKIWKVVHPVAHVGTLSARWRMYLIFTRS